MDAAGGRMVDPLLKWPGSKLDRRAHLAAMFSEGPRPVFCDPMCGSGAIPLVMPLHDRGAVVLGDAGPRLVAVARPAMPILMNLPLWWWAPAGSHWPLSYWPASRWASPAASLK